MLGPVSEKARRERGLDRLRGIEFMPAAGGVLRDEGRGRQVLTVIRRRLEHEEMVQGDLF